MDIRQLHPLFVGEVSGVDLTRPIDAETAKQIVAAMDRYAVLVFHDQPIDDTHQIAFSSLFGPLETTRHLMNPNHKLRLDKHIADISNLDDQNRIMAPDARRRVSGLANRLWHADSSYKRISATYSLLSAHICPSWGGETEFADMRAAYDALPERTKAEVEDLVAEHSIYTSRAKVGFTDFAEEERRGLPPVPQSVVRVHPGSGRKGLYLASHAGRILGMPLPEGMMLLHELMEHATQRQFVYTHKWRVGDLVMWDNRCTMHRGRPYDMAEVRDFHRTTVSDLANEKRIEPDRATARASAA